MSDKGNRQYTAPYLIYQENGSQVSQKLQQLDLYGKSGITFSEDWLQKFIFDHPNVLPVNEIEPIFNGLIPLCREIETGVGPLDILFVNREGLLTLVECKLWRNPDARREVVGQILDYAKEVSRWNYQDLQDAVRKALGKTDQSLYKIAIEEGNVDEVEFVDNVSRNLKKGRFLLLIVGDGIRESVENISSFLQVHANLNFAFALVETAVFSLPTKDASLIVQSRVIARTVEIERAIIRLMDERLIAETPPEVLTSPKSRRTKITEQDFFEILSKIDADLAEALCSFLDRIREQPRLSIVPGGATLMIKSEDKRFTLARFEKNGTTSFYGVVYLTERVGHPEISEQYLVRLSDLIENAALDKSSQNIWDWEIKKGNRNLDISDCLQIQDDWLSLMIEAVEKLEQAEEQDFSR
jgi:hypothetical protein